MDADDVADVSLAVSEAATNAVVHAYRESAGHLHVRAHVDGAELIVVVADTGSGMAPRNDSPGLGLGMPLMASVHHALQRRQPGRRDRGPHGLRVARRRRRTTALIEEGSRRVLSSRPRRDVPETVREVAREQLADAVHNLRDDRDDDPVAAVHAARKDLKKTRSLLRLARPGMDAGVYRRENRTLRDAGRALSGTRDADVLVEVADGLAERYGGQIPEASFTALRDELAADARAARAGDGDGAAGQAVAVLEGVAARAAGWPLDDCDRDALVSGAERAYRRGCAALAAALDEPTDERLHDLRKRAKDLWYHARLLEDAFPRVLKAQGKAAHRLSDLSATTTTSRCCPHASAAGRSSTTTRSSSSSPGAAPSSATTPSGSPGASTRSRRRRSASACAHTCSWSDPRARRSRAGMEGGALGVSGR
jgi:CHAD domain-containing protein